MKLIEKALVFSSGNIYFFNQRRSSKIFILKSYLRLFRQLSSDIRVSSIGSCVSCRTSGGSQRPPWCRAEPKGFRSAPWGQWVPTGGVAGEHNCLILHASQVCGVRQKSLTPGTSPATCPAPRGAKGFKSFVEWHTCW